jgi:hypothetical protein
LQNITLIGIRIRAADGWERLERYVTKKKDRCGLCIFVPIYFELLFIFAEWGLFSGELS